MYTLDKEFLYDSLDELARRIEACPASPEQTHASSFACDLRRAVGNQFNPTDPYSLLRVIEESKHASRKGKPPTDNEQG